MNQNSPSSSPQQQQQQPSQPRSYNTRSTNIALKPANSNNSIINQPKQQSLLGIQQQPSPQQQRQVGVEKGAFIGPVPFQGIAMTGNNISDDDDDDAGADEELNGINGPMDPNDSSNGTNENDDVSQIYATHYYCRRYWMFKNTNSWNKAKCRPVRSCFNSSTL